MGMERYCRDVKHQERLTELTRVDRTHPDDMERISLLYIIAGVEDLYVKRNSIYDFKRHTIRNCLKDDGGDFPSSLKALIRLGFNLYNGYQDNNMTPLALFWHLDSENRWIAQNALHLRFNR